MGIDVVQYIFLEDRDSCGWISPILSGDGIPLIQAEQSHKLVEQSQALQLSSLLRILHERKEALKQTVESWYLPQPENIRPGSNPVCPAALKVRVKGLTGKEADRKYKAFVDAVIGRSAVKPRRC